MIARTSIVVICHNMVIEYQKFVGVHSSSIVCGKIIILAHQSMLVARATAINPLVTDAVGSL